MFALKILGLLVFLYAVAGTILYWLTVFQLDRQCYTTKERLRESLIQFHPIVMWVSLSFLIANLPGWACQIARRVQKKSED